MKRSIPRGVPRRIHQNHIRRHSLRHSPRFSWRHSSQHSRCIFLGVSRHISKIFSEAIPEEFLEAFSEAFLERFWLTVFCPKALKTAISFLNFIDTYFVFNLFSNFIRYCFLPGSLINISLLKIVYIRLRTTMAIIFWDCLIICQIFLYPQVKRSVVISNNISIHELLNELSSVLRLEEISGKSEDFHWDAQAFSQNKDFVKKENCIYLQKIS